jgi:hypothetical protein
MIKTLLNAHILLYLKKLRLCFSSFRKCNVMIYQNINDPSDTELCFTEHREALSTKLCLVNYSSYCVGIY